jgi:hypothetical protein
MVRKQQSTDRIPLLHLQVRPVLFSSALAKYGTASPLKHNPSQEKVGHKNCQ